LGSDRRFIANGTQDTGTARQVQFFKRRKRKRFSISFGFFFVIFLGHSYFHNHFFLGDPKKGQNATKLFPTSTPIRV
jgi:hypothetical protein